MIFTDSEGFDDPIEIGRWTSTGKWQFIGSAKTEKVQKCIPVDESFAERETREYSDRSHLKPYTVVESEITTTTLEEIL